jgi:hypothetical protein
MFNVQTYYKGIVFKSRFEASMAYLLDLFKIKWLYEPYSMLLPNGLYYMPDFYAPDIKLWIECRGYESDEGEEQIKVFAELIVNNEISQILGKRRKFNLTDYMVVKPESVYFYEATERFGYGAVQDCVAICKCRKCKGFFIIGLSGSYKCRRCGCWDGDHHLEQVIDLNMDGGQLILERGLVNLKDLAREDMYRNYLKSLHGE